MDYPNLSEISGFLKNISKNIFFINGIKIATDLGNSRTMNVVMLGALLGLNVLPLRKETLEKAILRYLPPKLHEINSRAFTLGIETGRKLGGN